MTVDLITLSNRPEMCAKLAASIPMAIGDLAPWQHTIVDGDRYDIFTGYNHGAAETRGDVLVFVHDDVQFLGNPLTMQLAFQTLEEPTTGFVGVAGTRLLGADGCWWGNLNPNILAQCLGSVTQPDATPFGVHVNVWPPSQGQFGQVVVLDGVLLMCRREMFERLGGFDAETYKGFHFYDIDITLRASLANLTNMAAPIPMLHASAGVPSEDWNRNRLIFLQKFASKLPARIE